MRSLLLSTVLSICFSAQAATYPDRLIWVFGWNLNRDSDVTEISALLETAGKHHFTGAVVSFGLDTLCKKTPDFFQRLELVKKACDSNQLELIPAIFSVGYGGTALSHNRNLAEGLLVEQAPFLVEEGKAKFVPDTGVKFANGDFEEYRQNRMSGFNFHDQPGEISFVDTEIKQSGRASIRLENFTANQHGHGRVMQEVRVKPHRCYRVSLWTRTESLQPLNAFQISVLTEKRSLAPRTFKLPETGDWQKHSFVFNSLTNHSVRIYAGIWGGKKGKLWLDNWIIEEVGPLNVLHRPGTPVTVANADNNIRYVEGKDYSSLVDTAYSPYRIDRPSPLLNILPGSKIKDGQTLRVSWYHPMVIHDSQITVCMGEPALYEVFDHEAKLLAETLLPKRILLNMDEVRMGGTCEACKNRNLAELLGECITRQTKLLRKHLPNIEIAIWSDMLDPHHNAHGGYYLAEGDFTGSLKYVPNDLIIAVWGGKPRMNSLQFFADNHFRTWIACYYDADDLNEVKEWKSAATQFSNISGFMYTPWEKKYRLMPEFGDLFD